MPPVLANSVRRSSSATEGLGNYQGASRAAPGKSGHHARGEGERVLALESREGASFVEKTILSPLNCICTFAEISCPYFQVFFWTLLFCGSVCLSECQEHIVFNTIALY